MKYGHFFQFYIARNTCFLQSFRQILSLLVQKFHTWHMRCWDQSYVVIYNLPPPRFLCTFKIEIRRTSKHMRSGMFLYEVRRAKVCWDRSYMMIHTLAFLPLMFFVHFNLNRSEVRSYMRSDESCAMLRPVLCTDTHSV